MTGIPVLAAGDARTFEMLEWRSADALAEHVMHAHDDRASLCVAPLALGAADAWVRWAWVQDGAPLRLLHEILDAQALRLRTLHVRAMWCVDMRGSWLLHALRERGFRRVDEVVTYEASTAAASAGSIADMEIVDVAESDLFMLSEVDARAFAAPWRYPQPVLRAARAQVQIFAAARVVDRLVGYVLAVVHGEDAHVVRLAVDPSHGRRGFGTALLVGAMQRVHAMGARRVTLNTLQSLPAGHLYRRLGFRPLPRVGIDVLRREVPV
jgi:ribosomal protein S18 acetylase RimI-like enzyme